MSQGGSRRPYSRGGPRWHQRYKDYWDYDQNFSSEGSGSGSPKELAVSPKPAASLPPLPPLPPHRHYPPCSPATPYLAGTMPLLAPHLQHHHPHSGLQHHHQHQQDAWRHGTVGNGRRADRRRAAEAAVAGPSHDPLMSAHHRHHADIPSAAATSLDPKPGSPKRPRLHNHPGEAAMSGGDRRPPRRHYQPPRRGWETTHAPLLIDINQMQYRNARLAGWREPPPPQGPGEVWTAVLPHLRYHPQGAGPLGAFPAPHLTQRGETRVESEAARDLLLLRAEGRAGLELLNPHARHHIHHRGGTVRARAFRAPRYVTTLHPHHPHHPHTHPHSHPHTHPHSHPLHNHNHPSHAHHHHHQGAGGALLTPVPPLVAPPPTYQVFLNLLAMFPVGGGSPPYGQTSPPSPTNNYEQLLTLAERLGEDKPRGLSQGELDQLPLHTAQDTVRGSQSLCVVCMCEFERRQVLRALPCAHEFHAACVDQWLRTNRTCPICRGVVGAQSRTAGTH